MSISQNTDEAGMGTIEAERGRENGPRCLKILFMNSPEHTEQVLFPAIISVSAASADLLAEMALEMNVSLDELISSLAEDVVTGLTQSSTEIGQTYIPDKCSTADLLRSLE